MTLRHSAMIVQASTTLNISAAAAWELLQRRDTFLYITEGAMRFEGADQWPKILMATDVEFTTVAHPLRYLPGSTHTVRIVRVDQAAREVDTEEFGGMIRVWNHSMQIEPIAPSRCRYRDRIVLDAGRLTPVFWLFASLFYAYRQSRWRRLTRALHSSLGVRRNAPTNSAAVQLRSTQPELLGETTPHRHAAEQRRKTLTRRVAPWLMQFGRRPRVVAEGSAESRPRSDVLLSDQRYESR